jgi:hypothetical protein
VGQGLGFHQLFRADAEAEGLRLVDGTTDKTQRSEKVIEDSDIHLTKAFRDAVQATSDSC